MIAREKTGKSHDADYVFVKRFDSLAVNPALDNDHGNKSSIS
jgi:hypothetical protein